MNLKIYLISFEDENFPLNDDQKKMIDVLSHYGLVWIQLKWHTGSGVIPKTIDIIQGLFAVGYLRLKSCNHFLAVASVSGAFLSFYHRFFRFNFMLYSFEPHSEYMADNGVWKRSSLQFRLLSFLEYSAARRAKVITSGTLFMGSLLKEVWNVRATFIKIPSIVDEEKFAFSQSARDELRKSFGVNKDSAVLFYPGKFGGLYYEKEIPLMFKWLLELNPNLFFLVVSPQDVSEVRHLFEVAKIDSSKYIVTQSDFSQIHKFYSCADFGIVAVPPGPSKKYVSNIKVGEYLLSGLPYLIVEGVSEDYLYALEKKVGVVVKDFDEVSIKGAYQEMENFFQMNKDNIRDRCREVGLGYRAFRNLNESFRVAIRELFE